MQKRVAFYARVSTVDKGQDPETQLVVLRDYAERRDLLVLFFPRALALLTFFRVSPERAFRLAAASAPAACNAARRFAAQPGRLTCAARPMANASAGTSSVTVDPAAINAPFLTVTGATRIASTFTTPPR